MRTRASTTSSYPQLTLPWSKPSTIGILCPSTSPLHGPHYRAFIKATNLVLNIHLLRKTFWDAIPKWKAWNQREELKMFLEWFRFAKFMVAKYLEARQYVRRRKGVLGRERKSAQGNHEIWPL